MIIAAIIAILIGGGVYMVLQRGMLRIIMGITLLSHGVNLLILATGIGAWRTEPLMDRATSGEAADPLPQAFVLTAIVISMASTAVMLAMAALGRDDDTRSSDDPESGFRRYRSFQTMGRGTQRAGMDDRDIAREQKHAEQNKDTVRPAEAASNIRESHDDVHEKPAKLGESPKKAAEKTAQNKTQKKEGK